MSNTDTKGRDKPFEVMEPDGNWDGMTYERLVQGYWSWLFGPTLPLGKVFYDHIFYMRSNDMFKNVIDDKGNEYRKNFEDIHKDNAVISTNAIIFCPVIDAEFDDGYLDQEGKPIREEEMRQLAENDIKKWTQNSPTIQYNNGSRGSWNIVDDLKRYIGDYHKIKFIVFPDNGLAKYMDDPILPRGPPYNAYVIGCYLAFRILKEGEYTVISKNSANIQGKIGESANMEYQFNVRT